MKITRHQLRRIVETAAGRKAARASMDRRYRASKGHDVDFEDWLQDTYSDIDDYFDGGYDEDGGRYGHGAWVVYDEVEGRFVDSGVSENSPIGKLKAYHYVNGRETRNQKALQKAHQMMESDEYLSEKACWDGYKQIGMKKKGGRKVPNCVPEADESEDNNLSEGFYMHLESKTGVDKNIYRPGSLSFFKLFEEFRNLYQEGLYEARNSEEQEMLQSDIGRFGVYEGEVVPLDYPMLESREYLLEAEYNGKKVELNKPKRGGEGGKAYVYVNSGKKNKDGTIKVKKVSFGSSMPDAMGDSEAHRKRRKNYGDRHNCSDKDDKTKPGYWSCRSTKFFGRDISGWW